MTKMIFLNISWFLMHQKQKMFLDKFYETNYPECVGPVISMCLCPNKRYILFQSSNSLWMTKSNDEKQKCLFKFTFSNEIMSNYGCAQSSGWIDKNLMFTITTKGKIIIFSIQNSVQIKIKKVLSHPSDKYFTTADSFSSFIVAGDTEGSIFILSPETGEGLIRRISSNSIKKIAISRHNGLILIGDGTLFSFEIDQQILQNEDFDIKLIDLGFKAANITASKYTNVSAANSLTGTVLITNFKLTRTVETQKNISKLQFGIDSTLFIESYGVVGILYSMQPSFRWYENEVMKETCSFVVGRLLLVCSKNNNCFVAPLVALSSNSKYPICYTLNSVYEVRCKGTEISTVKHEKTGEIRAFKHAVSNGKMIACTGNGKISLFNIGTQQWIKTSHPEVPSIRGIAFWNDDLVIVVPNQKMHEFSLKIMSIKDTKIVQKKTIKLSGCPTSMRTNETSLVVVLTSMVIVIKNDEKYTETKHNVQCTIGDISLSTGKLFTLARGRHLQCEGKDILSNVSTFFIDNNTDVLVANCEGKIYACDVKQCTKFSLVGETDSNSYLLGGIIPDKLMAACYCDQAGVPPTGRSFTYFGDALAANIGNVEKATVILLPYLSEEYAKEEAVKGLSIALSRGKAKEAIAYIRAKPAIFGLPPNSRHYASDVIAQLLGAVASHDLENNKFISFAMKRKSINLDFAPLCKLVRVEEGFVPAACCAMFALRCCHSTKELIESGFGVVELPLPNDGSEEISEGVSKKLVDFYNYTLTIVCFDLLAQIKPDLALYVSQITNVPLHVCLSGKKEPNFSPTKAISYFASMLSNGKISKDDISCIAKEMKEISWDVLEFCCLLVNGDTAGAMNVIKGKECRTAVLSEIKNSQWSQLLQT